MQSTSKDQNKKDNDTSHFAKPLLAGAAGAFAAGLFGAIWHTKRKQAKYEQQEAVLLQQQQQQQVQTATSPAGSEALHKSSLPSSSLPSQQQQQHKLAGSKGQSYVPPSMSPAEFEIAKKEARFFAIKSLGYGTLLALTGAGVLATIVGYCMDVRNFREFSDKLHVIIPQRTARLRRFMGGKELEMTKAEEEELDALSEEME